ncbi:hypothetical protein GA0070610_1723 [Micromonospora echinofusca]|uniref:Uncharacterized protein n=1 Tax=Micromonospora echinofusca TaxID=47858 RepID=A0A1C5G6X8_MICEH|nr:hypothetical protein [Micromonospora echinofusca]SCG15490.1 hypothetical protein GA0070610_1723 [Micromonospora echinofusca]
MSRGLRSARLLAGHRAPAAVAPPQECGPLDVRPRRRHVGRARVGPTLAQRRALRRRAWVWRLLLLSWLLLTALVLWVAVRWIGPAGAGCPLVMGAVLLALAWCASVDLWEQEREMRNGR